MTQVFRKLESSNSSVVDGSVIFWNAMSKVMYKCDGMNNDPNLLE